MNETAATNLIAQLIGYLGVSPILLFFAVIFLFPTAVQIWAAYKQAIHVARFVKSYNDNVELVKSYQALVKAQQETNDKLIDLISITTATMQTLSEYIKNNWWCPIAKDTSLAAALRPRSKEAGQ